MNKMGRRMNIHRPIMIEKICTNNVVSAQGSKQASIQSLGVMPSK